MVTSTLTSIFPHRQSHASIASPLNLITTKANPLEVTNVSSGPNSVRELCHSPWGPSLSENIRELEICGLNLLTIAETNIFWSMKMLQSILDKSSSEPSRSDVISPEER